MAPLLLLPRGRGTAIPDDPRLHAEAGSLYIWDGEPQQALQWLTEGLELALRDDEDPDLVRQLRSLRAECLSLLGRSRDELRKRADQQLPNRLARETGVFFPGTRIAGVDPDPASLEPALPLAQGRIKVALQRSLIQFSQTGIRPDLPPVNVSGLFALVCGGGTQSGATGRPFRSNTLEDGACGL